MKFKLYNKATLTEDIEEIYLKKGLNINHFAKFIITLMVIFFWYIINR